MATEHHSIYASTGNLPGSKEFRKAEAMLLKAGKFMEAFDLNAVVIKQQFGDLYDEGLKKARNHYEKEIVPQLQEQSKKNDYVYRAIQQSRRFLLL